MDYSGHVESVVFISVGDTVAPGTTFARDLFADGADDLVAFPDDVTFLGPVSIVRCHSFTGFGARTVFADWLEVRLCDAFAAFPADVSFGATLSVHRCPAFAGFEGNRPPSKPNVVVCPNYVVTEE